MNLFTESPVNYSLLNNNQKINYNKIVKNVDFAPLAFLTLNNLSTVQDSGKILINLSFLPCPNLVFYARKVSFDNDQNYSWYGEIPFFQGDNKLDTCFNGTFFFENNAANGAIGLISLTSKAFQIYDLGQGTLMIGSLAHNLGKICGNEGDGLAERPIREPEDCIDNRLKVLFLYTAASTGYVPNINAVAQLAISETNGIFHNSHNYNQDITLAGVVPFYQFVEDYNTGSMKYDLKTRFAPNGTFHPSVEALRQQYHADMVVIYVAPVYTAEFGLSSINTNYDSAYCMVDITHAVGGDYTTTHELIHLFGARHYSDFNYQNHERGHWMSYGFFKFLGGWAETKRHYTLPKPGNGGTPGDYYPIPYLSNPDVDYDGKATGISDERDNARTIRENHFEKATFKTEWTGIINNMDISLYTLPPNPPFQYVCDRGAYLIANAGCGTGPYTHEWFRSFDGIYYFSVGAGSTLNISGAPYDGFIKLVSTDAINNTATSIRYCDFGCTHLYGNQGLYKAMGIPIVDKNYFSIINNPNKGNFVLQYNLQEYEEAANIYVIDVTGKRHFILKNQFLSKGINNQIEINIPEKLTNGLYYLQIEGKNFDKSLKFVIQ